jgi:hypothetical protein
MIDLHELLTIGVCVAIGVFVVNIVFYFLTPKQMRPDDFDPWDFK